MGEKSDPGRQGERVVWEGGRETAWVWKKGEERRREEGASGTWVSARWACSEALKGSEVESDTFTRVMCNVADALELQGASAVDMLKPQIHPLCTG